MNKIPSEAAELEIGTGQLSTGDCQAIYYLVQQCLIENGIYIDIGSYYGLSASIICQAVQKLSNKEVYTIDNYKGCNNTSVYGSTPELEYQLRKFNFVNKIKSDSIEYLESLKDNSIDFMFIDDDHSYNHFKIILPIAYKKLKIGGIISGHDYERRFKNWTPEFKKHLQDFMQETDVSENRLQGNRDCAQIPGELTKYEYHPDWIQDYVGWPMISMHHGVVLALHEMFEEDFEYFSPMTQYGVTQVWFKKKLN